MRPVSLRLAAGCHSGHRGTDAVTQFKSASGPSESDRNRDKHCHRAAGSTEAQSVSIAPAVQIRHRLLHGAIDTDTDSEQSRLECEASGL